MNLRTPTLLLVLGLCVWSAASPARADHAIDCSGCSVCRQWDRDEVRRRDVLRSRLSHLHDRIRLAEREDQVSHRDAQRFYDRVDQVRRFLREDRNLSSDEFRRRMEDLDDLERDFRDRRRRERSYYDRRDRRY
jgi:hypothetical protein